MVPREGVHIEDKETKTAFQPQESKQRCDSAQVPAGSDRMDGGGTQGSSSLGSPEAPGKLFHWGQD